MVKYICQEQMEVLQRSIVGETRTPISFKNIAERLKREWFCITNVIDMEAYKALVSFDDVLRKYFEDVRKWDEDNWCQTRRVWLEFYGIPFYAWSVNNIRSIGEEWGAVVCIDKMTEEERSYSTAKIFIGTCVWQTIQGWICLSVGGKGYDVYVKEVGMEVFTAECSCKPESH